MKILITAVLLVYVQFVWAQDKVKITGTKRATKEAAKENEFSPSILLGQISSNPLTNNFGLDLTDQAINLKGIFYESKNDLIVLGANVKGNNENSSLGLLGSGNLNAKLSSDISVTFNLPAKVRYTVIDDEKAIDAETYEKILSKPEIYNTNRQRFKYLTFGLEGAGAKYYLIDSTEKFSDMVEKRKFNGWSVFGQFNLIDFHTKKELAFIHSFRASYGEVNNVSDLTEYTIGNSSSFTDGSDALKFERKITGYFDEYFVQHQGIISYEFNLFDMDTTTIKAGLIAGADFVYNSRQKNFVRFNAGLNFPVEFTRSGKKERRLYIGAILSTTDPMNYRGIDDFSVANTFSASLRLVSPIRINIKGDKVQE